VKRMRPRLVLDVIRITTSRSHRCRPAVANLRHQNRLSAGTLPGKVFYDSFLACISTSFYLIIGSLLLGFALLCADFDYLLGRRDWCEHWHFYQETCILFQFFWPSQPYLVTLFQCNNNGQDGSANFGRSKT
jgi:hypothetical protein